jgi:hypothetical protein
MAIAFALLYVDTRFPRAHAQKAYGVIGRPLVVLAVVMMVLSIIVLGTIAVFDL